jgi:hypothetical protein
MDTAVNMDDTTTAAEMVYDKEAMDEEATG